MRLLLLFFIVSCATKELPPRHPLIDQFLTARDNFTGLTNRIEVYDEKGNVQEAIQNWDIHDRNVRVTLDKLEFTCSIANSKPFWRLCQDGQVGFCKHECKDAGWFSDRKCWVREFYPWEPKEFHVQARTECRNRHKWEY